MNIGIDIDDTISETFEKLIPYAIKYTIEDLNKEANIDFNKEYTNHLYIEEMNNWTKEESIEFWQRYYAEILLKVNIKEFAKDIIKKLRINGHKIYLITARWKMDNSDTGEITTEWLKRNKIEYDYLFLNASDKLKLIKENNIDIFIDDSSDNCKIVTENTNTKVYIMNSRMNEKFNHKKIKRVFSWIDLYHLISKGEI